MRKWSCTAAVRPLKGSDSVFRTATCQFLGSAMVALAVYGCGSGDPHGRQPISGTITLNGGALDSGSIRFEPQDDTGNLTSGGVIHSGKFYLPREEGLPAGCYKVSISSPGQRTVDPVMGQQRLLADERIPARYNVQTDLVVVVSNLTANEFEFQLKSIE